MTTRLFTRHIVRECKRVWNGGEKRRRSWGRKTGLLSLSRRMSKLVEASEDGSLLSSPLQ